MSILLYYRNKLIKRYYENITHNGPLDYLSFPSLRLSPLRCRIDHFVSTIITNVYINFNEKLLIKINTNIY